jgi:hypothetical protein
MITGKSATQNSSGFFVMMKKILPTKLYTTVFTLGIITSIFASTAILHLSNDGDSYLLVD